MYDNYLWRSRRPLRYVNNDNSVCLGKYDCKEQFVQSVSPENELDKIVTKNVYSLKLQTACLKRFLQCIALTLIYYVVIHFFKICKRKYLIIKFPHFSFLNLARGVHLCTTRSLVLPQ